MTGRLSDEIKRTNCLSKSTPKLKISRERGCVRFFRPVNVEMKKILTDLLMFSVLGVCNF